MRVTRGACKKINNLVPRPHFQKLGWSKTLRWCIFEIPVKHQWFQYTGCELRLRTAVLDRAEGQKDRKGWGHFATLLATFPSNTPYSLFLSPLNGQVTLSGKSQLHASNLIIFPSVCVSQRKACFLSTRRLVFLCSLSLLCVSGWLQPGLPNSAGTRLGVCIQTPPDSKGTNVAFSPNSLK